MSGGKTVSLRLSLVSAVCAALVGVVIGALLSTVMSRRAQYEIAVRDGKAIYAAVRAADEELRRTRDLLYRARRAANGTREDEPSVDYEAIAQLRAIPRPFSIADLSGRNYTKFSRETVDSLFVYVQQVDEL
jgi:hypothetical protein